MKERPRKETHYDCEVWVNPTTEPLRKKECLCLKNCEKLKPGQENNCHIAQSFYEICVKENIALMVAYCPYRDENPVNEKTEPMENEECLCMNCKGPQNDCRVLASLEKISMKEDPSLTIIITRCPLWKPY